MAAASGLFDIIGHADLCKKFAFYPKQDCTPLFEKFLEAAVQSGAALELNTAGLRKACQEIYPSRRILELACRKQVPMAFGSDAHAPGEVGLNFKEAVSLARDVGYTHCLEFAQRRREVVRI
jgi:histidinol-phosphatase (PHP family)